MDFLVQWLRRHRKINWFLYDKGFFLTLLGLAAFFAVGDTRFANTVSRLAPFLPLIWLLLAYWVTRLVNKAYKLIEHDKEMEFKLEYGRKMQIRREHLAPFFNLVKSELESRHVEVSFCGERVSNSFEEFSLETTDGFSLIAPLHYNLSAISFGCTKSREEGAISRMLPYVRNTLLGVFVSNASLKWKYEGFGSHLEAYMRDLPKGDAFDQWLLNPNNVKDLVHDIILFGNLLTEAESFKYKFSPLVGELGALESFVRGKKEEIQGLVTAVGKHLEEELAAEDEAAGSSAS